MNRGRAGRVCGSAASLYPGVAPVKRVNGYRTTGGGLWRGAGAAVRWPGWNAASTPLPLQLADYEAGMVPGGLSCV